MPDLQPRFLPLAAKAAVCHTLTYIVAGALAFHFLHYADTMGKPGSGMRSASDIMVMAGPLLQPLRGVLFAIVFYPLRGCLFGRRHGWLLMSWMLIALGILNTFGPAGGSIEGMIYTPAPALMQMRGYLEVVPQAMLFSALLCFWVNHPGKKWVNWLLGVLFVLAFALVGFGVLGKAMGWKGF